MVKHQSVARRWRRLQAATWLRHIEWGGRLQRRVLSRIWKHRWLFVFGNDHELRCELRFEGTLTELPGPGLDLDARSVSFSRSSFMPLALVSARSDAGDTELKSQYTAVGMHAAIAAMSLELSAFWEGTVRSVRRVKLTGVRWQDAPRRSRRT